MKRTYKRLSALLVALCLALSGVMPAVWAEEVTGMTYDFSVFGTVVAGGNALVWKANATNTELYNKLQTAYDGGRIQWYFDGTYGTEKSYNLTHSYGADATMSKGYTRIRMIKDDYIAFAVRNPGEGVWKVSVEYPLNDLGAEIGVYIVDSNTSIADGVKEEKNCLGTFNCYDANASVGELPDISVVTKGEVSLHKTWSPKANESYKIVLKSMNGEKNAHRYMFVSEVKLTPVVATVGDQSYTDADSAVAAIAGAASGTNVTINSDLSLSANLSTAANVTVALGATLDLAGKTLTVGEINIAGALVDTAGDSLLVTANDITCTSNNGGYLPLTDSTAGGYRLCKPTLETLGKVPGDNGSAAYWFHAHFEKEAAYGYTGVEIGVQMTWDGGSKGAWAGETFMGNWATQVKADKDLDIKLTVTGLDSVTNFKLTPVIKANGVTISMDTL